MTCAYCGTDEDRINGYCSTQCEELGEIAQERDAALEALRRVQWELEVAENLGDVADVVRFLRGRVPPVVPSP